ncbi:Trypsin [Oryctes borbonicus]|uniref:Trypsin n=1 Tax=Oryctes borbonicus TaxID=1629725 RepID=A0A0T6AW12_9SCAR|nr:Trypsin [Oryctes borbonicus]
MKVCEFIALCAIFGVAHGYFSLYWVVHTGICRNSHGFTFHCVHYNNCRRTFFSPHPRGQSKICGRYQGSLIMCCVEEDEDYLDELLPPKVADYDSHNFADSGYYPGSIVHNIEKPKDEDDDFNPANFLDNHEAASGSVATEMNPTQVLLQDMKPGGSMKEAISIKDSSTTEISSTKQDDASESTQSPKLLFTSSPLFDVLKANSTPIDTALSKLKDNEPIANKLNVPINGEIQDIIPVGSAISVTTNVLETNFNTVEAGTTNTPFTSPPLEDTQATDSAPNKLQEDESNPNKLKLLIENPESEEKAGGESFTIRTSNMEDSIQDVEFPLPYYMPSPENRTSLRICRSFYEGVTREDAWNRRTMNKAQIGYGNESNIEWLCTGSLISERYLLTAAHCRLVNGTVPPRHARVGDSRSTNPANNIRLQNFAIEEFILHPRYNSSVLQSLHDIAVVRLNASVIFTNFVRPGCLATKLDLASVPLWLLSVVPITFVHITTPRCRKLYNDTRYISDISQGCAVTDSYFFCRYDHGAPFVFVNTNYDFGYFTEIVGIASYGNPCGDRPAVSTRVLPYVPWIEGIVWPNQ